MREISILDLGLNNVASCQRMFEELGASVHIISKPEEVYCAEALILPGVGNFSKAMHLIEERSLRQPILKMSYERRIPILGICLGMQLLCERSDETVNGASSPVKGLGLINGKVQKLILPDDNPGLKLPNMGWRYTNLVKKEPWTDALSSRLKFYFVHSYYVQLDDLNDRLFSTSYQEEFTAGFKRDNIVGVQFHPEKSHMYGMQFLSAYMDLIK